MLTLWTTSLELVCEDRGEKRLEDIDLLGLCCNSPSLLGCETAELGHNGSWATTWKPELNRVIPRPYPTTETPFQHSKGTAARCLC